MGVGQAPRAQGGPQGPAAPPAASVGLRHYAFLWLAAKTSAREGRASVSNFCFCIFLQICLHFESFSNHFQSMVPALADSSIQGGDYIRA